MQPCKVPTDWHCNSLDGVNHVQSHLDGVLGVVVARVGQAAHAVVAVAQDLDAQAFVILRDKQTVSLSTF